MAKPSTPSPSLPLIIMLLTAAAVAADTEFIYGGCSQQKYTSSSPYETNLNSLLTSLVNSATSSSYNNFTVSGSATQDTSRGLYQCRGDLSMPECGACISRAASQVGSLCPASYGAAVQLAGCYIKYDNVGFLGVEDKTVVLKKCEPLDGGDEEEIGRRDAVLTGIIGGNGFYRSGGSGQVQGVAQCVSDLTAEECQDCLGSAIGRLKNECGSGVYGDMFLGKCYARFFTGGGAHSSSPFHKETQDKSSNNGEKTFAILIGLLAGVALLIIFLLFMRRVFGGNGK